ncbi:hypothetical protein HMPREF0044_0897 [Gleimia coleocanis DSM 15436]|uniref:Uncharacterized protein n=1 Tax=Gleimia coleocanis DSM 15436 TaxID=525245 RepID=C0W019_9ACTO|nr:hypothetical protein HMPREF0044_0897 [Gleimia coleocanis DSM 15436]
MVLQAAEKINKEVALESVPGSDVFADYQVTAEAPATIVYSYKYKKGVDLAFFKKHLEENAGKDLAILAEEIKKQFVSEGVKDIKVRYVYKDADDNVVWESTF